ncbi:hypothetical protein OH77DRAFT_134116 [Trametes cingulata]|nr:hypothetical protein OH77DRAFT_134116 [Trametes cingulata]
MFFYLWRGSSSFLRDVPTPCFLCPFLSPLVYNAIIIASLCFSPPCGVMRLLVSRSRPLCSCIARRSHIQVEPVPSRPISSLLSYNSFVVI